ncbi:crotonase/enoyl-CoA hydratase family protein [Tomitella gaofuii]|uniref:crotonase/enoyl-CoA hydratase family protein n=1 Tax=Tomitella gaofuii TaxID=2760083 RepID=UPI0015FDFA07|nr:crotonase/enoyl-CoA hydratase family protein [Tomitella gaofuii]
MSDSPLLIERDGHVVIWTLNAPETRNPISEPDMVAALEDAVAQADADSSIRAAVLTGAGSAFSSGGNVKHMRDRTGMFGGSPAELRQGYRRGIQRIPRALYHCEIPLVAAVNGPAIGAGCDLAMMCDLRVASSKARFAESFVKVGIIPGDGGAWLLPRIIGAARAAEMALTGDPVDAATALEWGMVSAVVEPDELLPTARALADRVAVNPPQVVRMTKRLLREAQHQTLESALEYAAAMQPIAHHTADHAEAVAAMLERRDPQYSGE